MANECKYCLDNEVCVHPDCPLDVCCLINTPNVCKFEDRSEASGTRT